MFLPLLLSLLFILFLKKDKSKSSLLPPSPRLLQYYQKMVLPQSLSLWHHLLSIFLPLLLSLLIILFLKKDKSKSSLLPPSPPKLPILGNLHQLGTLPHRSLHALAQKYGSLMLLHMGQTATIVVSSAEMAKEVLKTHDMVFANRPITTASKAFVWGCRDITFAQYGEYWRQVRKIAVLDLLSVKRVQSYRFVREEEIANMVNKLSEASAIGNPVNLSKIIVTVNNNIISKIALGRKLEGDVRSKSEMATLTKDLMDLFGHFSVEDMFPSLGWVDVLTGLDGRMKKLSRRFHEFLDEVIEEHMSRKRGDDYEDRKDFVDILIDCQKDLSLGIPLSRNDLQSLIMDMFVAGTDTTYTTLEWAMTELIKSPEVMKKVQEEIRLVVGNKPVVDEKDINQMNYLSCVIKETLRLHPPVPLALPHESTAPVKIGQYSIPAKTRAIINLWAVARDPKVWDKPDEFIPDRFINNPIDFKGFDYEFIPFGAGRRGCPGIAFAVASLESILSNLLCWFDWELPSGSQDLETEGFGLSVYLKNHLHLIPVSITLPS